MVAGPSALGELVAQLGCDLGFHQHVPVRVQSVPVVRGVNALVRTATLSYICTYISKPAADAETMDIVEMVLTGRVNKGLVSLIQMAGGSAVGLCGKDSNLLSARQMVEDDIGFVGEVTRVNKALLESLVEADFIPVVSTVAVDAVTGQALNVNADTAAGEIAASLRVRLLHISVTKPNHVSVAVGTRWPAGTS